MSRIKELLPEPQIETYYYEPPIPINTENWSAIDVSTYDGQPNDPIGRGNTEEEAINDLVLQLLDLRDGD